MKKIILLLLLFTSVFATEAQVFLGLRDSKYGYIGYHAENGLTLQIDESFYSAKFKYQYLRVNVGYQNKFADDQFDFYGGVFGGFNYIRSFANAGVDIHGKLQIVDYFGVRATLMPMYDTYYKGQFCFQGGVHGTLNEHLAIVADYTNIPTNREKESRIRGGFDFSFAERGHKNTGALIASPMLAYPLNTDAKTLRIEVNMRYMF